MSERSRFGAPGDGPIDRAIDRAVHELMNVDPPRGLRRRVLARMVVPSARRGRTWRFAFATAVLASVLLAVVVIRREAPTPITEPAPVVAVGPAVAPLPAAPAPATDTSRAPSRPGHPLRTVRMAHVFGPPDGRVSGAAFIEPSDGAAPVEPPSSGRPETRAGSPTPAELTLVPLEIRPLQVAPLWAPR